MRKSGRNYTLVALNSQLYKFAWGVCGEMFNYWDGPWDGICGRPHNR